MQTHTERRTGTERRLFETSLLSSAATEPHWNAALPGFMAGDADDSYDPYDPYWEPLKGQDDD